MTTITTDSGLVYEDLTTGNGPMCTGRSHTAIVHYSGWLQDATLAFE